MLKSICGCGATLIFSLLALRMSFSCKENISPFGVKTSIVAPSAMLLRCSIMARLVFCHKNVQFLQNHEFVHRKKLYKLDYRHPVFSLQTL